VVYKSSTNLGSGSAVTSVTGTSPIVVNNTNPLTPVISITQATTSTSGYLTSTDWNTFNGKLTSALTSSHIFVGNGSNVATDVAMSNHATLSNTGAITIPGTLVHPTIGSTYEYSLKPAAITGQRNTMIGVGTGTNIQSSNENTGFGYNVLRSAINGLTGTTGVGYAAWENLQTGQYCTQVGYDNFGSLTSGDLITVVGVSNGGSALTASGCSIVGQLNATSATTLTAAQIFGRVIAPSATTLTEANLFGKDICVSAPYITTVNAFGKDLATWIDSATHNMNLLGNAMVQGADTDVSGSTFVGTQMVNSDRMAISNCYGVGSHMFSGADSTMSSTVAVGSGIFECDSSSNVSSCYSLGQNINANSIVSNLAYTVFVGANLGSALSYSNYNLLMGFDMISNGNTASILSSVLLGNSIGVNNSDPQITNSVIIGPGAGSSVTSIDGEVYIGQSAGGQVTNSYGNSFIGSYAGYGVTSGIGNIAIGPSAMVGIDTSSSIAIGYQAGGSWNGGSYLFMGTNTGYSGKGDYVIGIGIEALTACGTVSRTIAIGAGAGSYYSTDVADCVLIGQNCEASSTTAKSEFCVGSDVSPTYTYQLGWGGKPSTAPASQTVTITPTVSTKGTVGADLALCGGADNAGGKGGSVYIKTAHTDGVQYNVISFDYNGNIRAYQLHNNATAQGSAANQDIRSGTYTPTLTNVANVTASTAYQCQWMRVGNVVTVSGKIDIDPTTTLLATQLGISIPVASNIGATEDCAGTAFASGIAGQGAAIRGDAANDRAELVYVCADITNQPMYFTFTYEVI
jgi:hypothetical protein